MSSEHKDRERALRLKGRWMDSGDLEELDDDAAAIKPMSRHRRAPVEEDWSARSKGRRRKLRRARDRQDLDG